VTHRHDSFDARSEFGAALAIAKKRIAGAKQAAQASLPQREASVLLALRRSAIAVSTEPVADGSPIRALPRVYNVLFFRVSEPSPWLPQTDYRAGCHPVCRSGVMDVR
jgi:hypothetical protein